MITKYPFTAIPTSLGGSIKVTIPPAIVKKLTKGNAYIFTIEVNE